MLKLSEVLHKENFSFLVRSSFIFIFNFNFYCVTILLLMQLNYYLNSMVLIFFLDNSIHLNFLYNLLKRS